MRDQLTKVLFVQALRAMIASDNRPSSWLGQGFGYGSESAFSNAFKRVTGRSPAKYRAH